MPMYKVTTTLPHISGKPEDSVVNTLYFNGPGDGAANDYTAIRGMIDAFFNAPHAPSVVTIASQLSSVLSRVADACEVAIYTGPPALSDKGNRVWGSPQAIEEFTLAASAGGPDLPSEVAGVMSFNAALGGVQEELPDKSRPRARRRGRIYVGPWKVSASAAHGGIPSFDALGVLVDGGTYLLNQSAAIDLPWQVYSEKDNTMRPVVGGFVDAAWDTQRRRGEKASGRYLIPRA